ncbi:sulfurtransferase [Sphingomonas sanguinis]|jgi:thiosulfate/3-mercaptopyruvate sulfurtransferase|uniref:Sulfurtransferase n=1 Tax=Sphingomonas sanguinis TaxID=33051 RepID=A0A7Y7UT84_9SPHN|nr:sulfurtransferase [Sphingomonas sanguinis]MBZ6383256.1 sulfurtransferase [Sphingomonas sanguinis]NNG49920.1 sulfurtransferase [Sphingomonas sanguinis]NNG53743.1 sulfurtransferase [Sphingomonas sanguinis]NVP32551.1 sulfurtransferase [Sphingomonas sanguinis]
MPPLITPEELAAIAGEADVRILDVTYFLDDPDGTRARHGFEDGHIPGARFLPMGVLADPDSDLPMTLPPAEHSAHALSEAGVGHADRIILYDRSPLHSAARVWWLLSLFGAPSVALLDGGLEAWRAAGHPVTVGPAGAPEAPGLFLAQADLARVRSLREVRTHVEAGDAQIVDARSPGRFAGAEPEPRPGVEPGHIPGAINLPYSRLFEADGRWKSPDAIAAEFAAAGVDPAKPMVATCGSGITACVLAFGAERIGGLMPVYDGSWTEWGSDPSTPKAKDA